MPLIVKVALSRRDYSKERTRSNKNPRHRAEWRWLVNADASGISCEVSSPRFSPCKQHAQRFESVRALVGVLSEAPLLISFNHVRRLKVVEI